MKRIVEKSIERFGALFFAALRAVAAATGASLGTSVLVLILLCALLEVPAFLGGVAVSLFYNAFVAMMFFGARRVGLAAQKAIESRDFAEAMRVRAMIDGKGEPRSPAIRALKRVGDGELLLDFEKWSDAADTLALVDLGRLPALARPGILSELGYARAHAGDPERGLADIARAFELADAIAKYPEAKRFHLARRRGIALSLAGQHGRAIEELAPLARDFYGSHREWAEAFYFLGRSHASLGEKDAAASALAIAAGGDGPFVARAWKELEVVCDAAEFAELRAEIKKQREAN